MRTYCSPAAHTSDQQGLLPSDFWSNVEIQSGSSSSGGRFVQCKKQFFSDILYPFSNFISVISDWVYPTWDVGPPQPWWRWWPIWFQRRWRRQWKPCWFEMYRIHQNSSHFPSTISSAKFLSCSYNHYVELVEPADKRACIKCCDNFSDCPLDRGGS